ncbi:MAG TPA: alpha-L-arabinofuranosidase [Planctomycetota bacterium]|nr:alpha-L-arabinofuranosidase [Planctomycetota bacterium]
MPAIRDPAPMPSRPLGRCRRLRAALIALTALAAAHGEEVVMDAIVIDARTTVAEQPRARLGINCDYLVDAPAADLTAALRPLAPAYIRYPGGGKSQTNLWSTPPFARSEPALARLGPGEWPSCDARLFDLAAGRFAREPLGFDDFLGVCRDLGAQPTVVVAFDPQYRVAVDGGSVVERERLIETAVAWVRHARGAVRWWELGNETDYLHHYGGTDDAARYAADVLAFARAMKAADPTIRIGINGRYAAWWATVLPLVAADIDFLAVHDYPGWEWAGYDAWLTRDAAIGVLRIAAEAIDRHAPPEHRARLAIALTETGVIDWSKKWTPAADLGHALPLAELVGRLLAEPRLAFFQFWNTRWVDTALGGAEPGPLDAFAADWRRTPSGDVLAAWAAALRDRLVAVRDAPLVKGFASVGDDGGWTLILLNKDRSRRVVRVTAEGLDLGLAKRRSFTGTGPEDRAPTWSAEEDVADLSALELPPVSMTVVSSR